jgi:hypothetical protein
MARLWLFNDPGSENATFPYAVTLEGRNRSGGGLNS